jgi:[acyl-carrier-protein] S-malonyltransferase
MAETLAFVFPGQGSQKVGMLQDFFEGSEIARLLFEEASDALGYDLAKLIQEGPVEQLNQTEFTQPAILASSIALWSIWLERKGPMPAVFAGHSLGEYSALVATSSLNFADAVKLVSQRGKLMQAAVKKGEGAMAAILALTDEQVKTVCEEASTAEAVVAPANFNAPGQVVIAGHTAAVEKAMQLAKDAGARKVVLLPVSVPSHCVLMKAAAEQLATALEKQQISSPSTPIVNNVSAVVEEDASAVKQALIEQLYKPVRWVESIQAIEEMKVDLIVECGPGKVLTALNKRIVSKANVLALSNQFAFDNLLEELAKCH